jgi:hypothetical protein
MKSRIRIAGALLLAGCLAASPSIPAQALTFDVVWSTLGERLSAGKDAVAVQRATRVVRVDVQPSVIEVAAGTQVCLSSMRIQAFGPDGRSIAGAPVIVEVRENHKLDLQLTRPKGDICMRPASPGEYPIRFTSKLPAPNDAVHGAQVFLRAR